MNSKTILAFTIGLALLAPRVALDAAPPAGTSIANQASATYTDSVGTERQTTSNITVTEVQQVAAVTLVADRNTLVPPGGQAVFPHTLTNTGNGPDTFNLSASNIGGDQIDLTGINLYADADQNGIPDNLTPITDTGSLLAGDQFHFVVVGSVPLAATAAQQGILSVVATSVFDNTKTAANTDTAQAGTQAIVNLTKAMSATSGDPGTTNTVTLTYLNNGNNTATNVVIRDSLPAGMEYVPGSGLWSVSGATPLTDSGGGDPVGIDYNFTNPQVTAILTAVAPSGSGTITFQIVIAPTAPAGDLTNTGNVTYDDGSGVIVGPQDSNTVTFRVNQIAAVTMDDNPLQTGDTTLNDVVEVATASQGDTVEFQNRVHNTGNGTDAFNITLSGDTFPAGTTIALFQSDGITPLLDTTSDPTPDTGPVTAGDTYTVVVKATLPPGASGGGPYTVTVTATSTVTGSVSDTTTDSLGTIVASTVDITNDAPLPSGAGAGLGPEPSPVTIVTNNPNTTATISLHINNTSAVTDNYDLAASTDSSFGSFTLPVGWTVTFKNIATPITNTGDIATGASLAVTVEVEIPANAAASDVELYFRALSSVTGATDIKHDRVTVAAVPSLAVEPNNTGNLPAGGVIDYTHTVCNNGNLAETVTLTATNSAAGWNTTLYLDTNDNGVLDGPDALYSGPLNVAIAQCVRFFAKVSAPPGAAVNDTDTATVTGTAGSGASDDATDTSTVTASDVTLLKEQALDAACDGTADTAYGTANITTGALPGVCIRYRITVTNNGTGLVTTVHVFDTTPSFTKRFDGAVAPSVTGGSVNTFTGPADGAAGSFDLNVGIVAPSTSAVCEFGVQIDP